MLIITGWLGSEAVYRYGLGVMSLPVVESNTDGHDHQHRATSQDKLDHVEELKSHPHADERVSDVDSSTENSVNDNAPTSHEGEHHH